MDDESFKDVRWHAEENDMSDPFGDSRDPTRPEGRPSNGFSFPESDELPWRYDPSVTESRPRATTSNFGTELREQAGESSRSDSTRRALAGVRARVGLRETGLSLDMTEHAEIVDGLAADRYVVVLRSGQPTIVQLSRASAIEQGLTVVDPDQAMLAALLASQQRPGPLDVTAGPPLRDLRSSEGARLGDADIVDEVKAEMSIPVRPEAVEPVLTSSPATIAEAPVDLPIGNRVVDDAPPAIRSGRPWISDAPPMPDTELPGLRRAVAPLVPEAAVPVARRDLPPTVVLRALDDPDDEAAVSIPQWAVIETPAETPAESPIEIRAEVEPQVSALGEADPHGAMPISALPWQEPVWGTDTAVPQAPVPTVLEPVVEPVVEPVTEPVMEPVVVSTPDVPTTTPILQSVPALEDPPHKSTGWPDGAGPVGDRPVGDGPVGDRPVSDGPVSDDSDTAVPAISITGLVRTYVGPVGPVPVLKGVNLDLAPGDLLVLRGASGSGLTTLLNCAAGLDVPDSGQVYVNGEEMGAWSEADRARFRAASAGFIPQTHELVDDLNARDNVLLPLLAAGWGLAPARREATRLLESFSIADRTFFYPSQMSHSERVRTAVARALAGDPFLVWADDPTAGLDDDNAQFVVNALLAHHERGATVVVVSRDRRFLASTARVSDLVDGVIAPADAVASLMWNN